MSLIWILRSRNWCCLCVSGQLVPPEGRNLSQHVWNQVVWHWSQTFWHWSPASHTKFMHENCAVWLQKTAKEIIAQYFVLGDIHSYFWPHATFRLWVWHGCRSSHPGRINFSSHPLPWLPLGSLFWWPRLIGHPWCHHHALIIFLPVCLSHKCNAFITLWSKDEEARAALFGCLYLFVLALDSTLFSLEDICSLEGQKVPSIHIS